jgi:DNA repair protein RadA/Sms
MIRPAASAAVRENSRNRKGRAVALTTLSGEIEDAPRILSGISELDRVTGGGFVRGSALLVGGDPGIGKSTLLMQAAAALPRRGHRIIYVSGEEAVAQVRLRAQRLGAADTERAARRRDQCRGHPRHAGAGTAARPRHHRFRADAVDRRSRIGAGHRHAGAFRLAGDDPLRQATGAAIILVGHVTKEGQIAGPRVVEHMVDGVLYFEGEGGHHYRILRTVKNRFGATDEIGVFEMTSRDCAKFPIRPNCFSANATRAPGRGGFRGHGRHTAGAGRSSRRWSLLQALGTPRRAVVGWDSARLADDHRRAGSPLRRAARQHDVYLNVAGGYRISEPAADVAVAAALVSSLAGLALPADCVYFGEVSLSGAIRPVAQTGLRLKEAEKLGFASAVLPSGSADLPSNRGSSLALMEGLPDLVVRIAGSKAAGLTGGEED